MSEQIFKVGDIVKVKEDYKMLKAGETYKITEPSKLFAKVEGIPYIFYADRFELVEQEKSEFKVGDLVKAKCDWGFLKKDQVYKIKTYPVLNDRDLCRVEDIVESYYTHRFEKVKEKAEQVEIEEKMTPKFKMGDKIKAIKTNFFYNKGENLEFEKYHPSINGTCYISKWRNGEKFISAHHYSETEFELVEKKVEEKVEEKEISMAYTIEFKYYNHNIPVGRSVKYIGTLEAYKNMVGKISSTKPVNYQTGAGIPGMQKKEITITMYEVIWDGYKGKLKSWIPGRDLEELIEVALAADKKRRTHSNEDLGHFFKWMEKSTIR